MAYLALIAACFVGVRPRLRSGRRILELRVAPRFGGPDPVAGHDGFRWQVQEFDLARVSPWVGRGVAVFAALDLATLASLAVLPPGLLVPALSALGVALVGPFAAAAAVIHGRIALSRAALEADHGGVSIRRAAPRPSVSLRWSEVTSVRADPLGIVFSTAQSAERLFTPWVAPDRRAAVAAELERVRLRAVADEPVPREMRELLQASSRG